MNKRLISSELRRGFTGYGFWLALLIGCAIAVWHGCCMEGAPVGFSHAGDVIYWNEKMMFPPNNVAKSLMGMTLEIVLSGSFSLWGKLYFTCFPLYFVLAVLLVAVYGIIFASFGLLLSFYIENRFLVLIAPFIIWMAITTIFSFLTFPELMGANPFYFLMLAHPAGGSHHQAVSVLISTIVYAALGIGGYFMAGRKRDIF